MVTVNPFSEAWKRKMNTQPTGPVYFGPFEVTPQVGLLPESGVYSNAGTDRTIPPPRSSSQPPTPSPS